jgi:hypothetical protein
MQRSRFAAASITGYFLPFLKKGKKCQLKYASLLIGMNFTRQAGQAQIYAD